jgi:flagellar basal-body rod protein FlgG
MISVAGMPVGEIPIFNGDLSEQLIDIGNNQYVLPNGRIAERLDNPEINQFYLESSNVNLADSMSEMILTQRAYSMNTKVLQSTDEMMQRINEFKQ